MRRRKIIRTLEQVIQAMIATYGGAGATGFLAGDNDLDAADRFKRAFGNPVMKMVKRRQSKEFEFEFYFDSLDEEILFKLKYNLVG